MNPVGSLLKNYDYWSGIGASNEVLDWIKYGVKLPFKGVSEVPNYYYENNVHSYTHRQFVNKEIKDLLLCGAISNVDEAPHCVSALSCVPKKGRKLRLVIDLRPHNEHKSVFILKTKESTQFVNELKLRINYLL